VSVGSWTKLIATFGLVLLLALVHLPARASDQAIGTSGFASSLIFGSSVPLIDLGAEPDWLAGLSISGYLQNTSGMWANSSALTRFGRQAGEHHGANSLAVEREQIQLDFNYHLNTNNQFFVRFSGVYEPPYPWEAHNIEGTNLLYNQSQSEIYNRYDVRDAYWKTTLGPLTLFSGRQIVTWGESLSFRVSDVVNPQDLSWNFGFANLEQSRLPLWMVHPLLSLPSVGPFSSNFLETIWNLPWQPLYSGISYVDQRYAGQSSVAGAVNLLPPGGGRFDTYPYPFAVSQGAPAGTQIAFPQIQNFTNPLQTFRLPADTWGSSTGGVRLHTLCENAELTAIYWHGHQVNPTPFVAGNPASGQNLQQRYPNFEDLGATLNRPIYLPGDILANLPLVLRSEGIWQNRTPFNTLSLSTPSAVGYSSTLNTLVALDLDGLDVPWLSSTGSFNANLEWNNYTLLNPSRDFVYSGYVERWRHNEENLLLSVGTNWWWGAIAPTLSGIYNPDGTTFELFPSVTLTPPWTSRYAMTLQYIGILGNDRYSAYAGGNFKGKSILLMSFQYSFDIVRGNR